MEGKLPELPVVSLKACTVISIQPCSLGMLLGTWYGPAQRSQSPKDLIGSSGPGWVLPSHPQWPGSCLCSLSQAESLHSKPLLAEQPQQIAQNLTRSHPVTPSSCAALPSHAAGHTDKAYFIYMFSLGTPFRT